MLLLLSMSKKNKKYLKPKIKKNLIKFFILKDSQFFFDNRVLLSGTYCNDACTSNCPGVCW